jgi:hypothetical protein
MKSYLIKVVTLFKLLEDQHEQPRLKIGLCEQAALVFASQAIKCLADIDQKIL